eukprot:TRINITY_DN56615_c0_g1_i1.p1 TRINITY_DN56615_c0_g1~~TRINITY_DN56615_c0_g1_i1.p1  ORF type:complete len:894 (+),score=203.41 TRINITY_DN56615_c0_g1_i1:116-2797(+)
MSGGSLLRLFQSEYFDAHLHMHYLLRMEQSGVQDYLVNELYKMTDDDIDFYLPQLCQIALLRYDKSSLHRFLLDKAAGSMPFALKIHWLVQSLVEDKSPELYESAMAMLILCEAASVNSAPSRADPPRIERTVRSSSDPDLQSQLPNRQSSEEDADGPEAQRQMSAERGERRRSRTPGAPMKSREPRHPDAPPTPSSDRGVDFRFGLDTEAEADAEREAKVFDPPPRTQEVEEKTEAQPEEVEEKTVAQPEEDKVDSSLSEVEALRAAAVRHLLALEESFTPAARAQALGGMPNFPNPFAHLGQPVAFAKMTEADEDGPDSQQIRQGLMMKWRCDYFTTQNQLVSLIMRLSVSLAALTEKSERKAALKSTLVLLNRWLLDRRLSMAASGEGPLFLLGVHIPLWRSYDSLHQMLHIHVEHCRIFSSATRAPFVLVFESANLDEAPEDRVDAAKEEASATGAMHQALLHKPITARLRKPTWDRLANCVANELRSIQNRGRGEEEDEKDTGDDDDGYSSERQRLSDEDWQGRLHRLIKEVTPEHWCNYVSTAAPGCEPRTPSSSSTSKGPLSGGQQRDSVDGTDDSGAGRKLHARAEARKRKELALQTRDAIWGESWQEKTKRIRKRSPYRHYASWSLNAMMVKGGDDLRQELLASQIIEQFSAIFQEAGLPLWLKATKVLVTSSTAGFLEFIHDSISVDAMKKLYPGKTLAEIFKVAFADKPFEAKKNFIESSAAYSLVVYFLQVKDRHNGNLMMLTSGHVVHIDFGFMLSNSPGGNMAFENSPFKLTQEFLDVMDGECSEQYEYFRTLLIRGFLESRKHMERIILQVRMMLTGSKMPCFREGPDFVLQTLQDRFFANLTEEACIEKVVELIDTSVNNWRTIQYDNYQRLVNGIL